MLALNRGIETMLPPGGTTVRIPPARAVRVRVAPADGCLLFPCLIADGQQAGRRAGSAESRR